MFLILGRARVDRTGPRHNKRCHIVSFFTVRTWGHVDGNVHFHLCQFGFLLHRAVSLQQFLWSGALSHSSSFRKVLISLRGTVEQQVMGHTSQYLMQ